MSRPIRRAERGRRPDIESELSDQYHVGWEYLHQVPTAHFDIDKSLRNQARFEALDEPTVALYQEGVERGDPFPAVIAYRSGRRPDGKLVIIDGNHRLVAHDRASRPIDVYVVEPGTKPILIARMTFAFNTRHGRPTSEEERVHHALFLVDNGASLDAAAAAVNVPLRIVRKAALRAKADLRAAEVGADMREWEAIGGTNRSRLLNVSTDEGFVGAIHLAYAARLGSDEVFELVALLNTSKSAAKQRQILRSETDRYSGRIQDAGAGVLGTADRKTMSAKGRVGVALGMLLSLPDDDAATARLWAEPERAEAAERLLGVAERLRKLAAAIDPSVS
jgi:hypothetical protein